MRLSGDSLILWQHGPLKLNATILAAWAVMAVLVLGSWLITRRLSSDAAIPRWQNLLEVIVQGAENQIREAGLRHPRGYLDFICTLFLFIAVSSILSVVPWFEPPTASLSTTAGLAICVFVSVPLYAVAEKGIRGYLRGYVQPTWLMLPFNVISDVTRTLALAVRLFGNMMSDTMIVGILVTIAPFIFPIVMHALGLLTGLVQAYIFAILATVYIAAATRTREEDRPKAEEEHKE